MALDVGVPVVWADPMGRPRRGEETAAVTDVRLPREAQELLAGLQQLDDVLREARRELDESHERLAEAIALRRSELMEEVEAAHRRASARREEVERIAAEAERKADEERVRIVRERQLLDDLVRNRTAAFEFIGRVWADYELALGRGDPAPYETAACASCCRCRKAEERTACRSTPAREDIELDRRVLRDDVPGSRAASRARGGAGHP
jgi:hypothetical protein